MNRCRCGPRHNDSTPPPCSVGFVSTRLPAYKPAIRFASFSGEADSGCWLIGRFIGRERRSHISSWLTLGRWWWPKHPRAFRGWWAQAPTFSAMTPTARSGSEPTTECAAGVQGPHAGVGKAYALAIVMAVVLEGRVRAPRRTQSCRERARFDGAFARDRVGQDHRAPARRATRRYRPRPTHEKHTGRSLSRLRDVAELCLAFEVHRRLM